MGRRRSEYDLLSEKLYLLDGREYAQCSTSDDEGISSDLFLYGRCCVVANGRTYYEEVLKNPAVFPKDLFFEALLDLPERAWFRKTGKELEYLPKYIYETGFNPHGWGADTIIEHKITFMIGFPVFLSLPCRGGYFVPIPAQRSLRHRFC